jgi:hypothetical protein
MSKSVVCTLATSHALQDLQCFLKSLTLWEPNTTVYLFADAATAKAISALYPGKIIIQEALNAYSGKTRQGMERIPINGKTLWYEFQMEKLRLLRWVFEAEPAGAGVFYLDADICHFSALPSIPDGYDVAVSPHMIRARDEAKFGAYNAGYVWMRSVEAVEAWYSACPSSRFFEQSALEVFDTDAWRPRTYKFPAEINYGWWRMFQSDTDFRTLQRRWGIRRDPNHSGITVDGAPLGSVHTHWITNDFTTTAFNFFVREILKKIAHIHEPAKRLLALLEYER